jgi:hypothetical protein
MENKTDIRNPEDRHPNGCENNGSEGGLAEGLALISQAIQGEQDRYKSDFLQKLPSSIVAAHKAKVGSLEDRLLLHGSLSDQFKLLLEERARTLQEIEANSLHKRYMFLDLESTKLELMHRHFQTLPSSDMKYVFTYQLGRSYYKFLQLKVRQAKEKLVAQVNLDDGKDSAEKPVSEEGKRKPGRPKVDKQDLSFADLFAPDKQLPKTIKKALKEDRLIDVDGSWLGHVRGLASDIVAFAKALEDGGLIAKHDSIVLQKAFTREFPIEITDRMFRDEPPRESFIFYKRYILRFKKSVR